MNRQQALEWLVENVAKWPVDINYIEGVENWDFTFCRAGDVILRDSITLEVIAKSDWLAATDNMEAKYDD